MEFRKRYFCLEEIYKICYPGAGQILALNADVESFGLTEPAINMGPCVKLMSKCSLIEFWLYNVVDPLK